MWLLKTVAQGLLSVDCTWENGNPAAWKEGMLKRDTIITKPHFVSKLLVFSQCQEQC